MTASEDLKTMKRLRKANSLEECIPKKYRRHMGIYDMDMWPGITPIHVGMYYRRTVSPSLKYVHTDYFRATIQEIQN